MSNISEFNLIDIIKKTYNENKVINTDLNYFGIGDDCALFNFFDSSNNEDWAISKDLLIENQHFFSDIDPYKLGYKSLAVNLSDLAAMGATPCFFLIGIALPAINNEWINRFNQGVLDLSKLHNCILIGGDTTKSNNDIIISITVIGKVAKNLALKRNNAQINEDIWVSGCLGDARLALGKKLYTWQLSDDIFNNIINKLELPTPRIELGKKLLHAASSCLDISDGLLGDLQHILTSSNKSANIYLENIPISDYLKSQTQDIINICSLSGGDDYELCFTAPSNNKQQILNISTELNLPLTIIGNVITKQAESIILYDKGNKLNVELFKSFDHFNK